MNDNTKKKRRGDLRLVVKAGKTTSAIKPGKRLVIDLKEPNDQPHWLTNTRRKCACGCGKTTARTFAMGHDSKAKSLLLRVNRGELKASDIPSSLRAADLRKDSVIARLLRKVGG